MFVFTLPDFQYSLLPVFFMCTELAPIGFPPLSSQVLRLVWHARRSPGPLPWRQGWCLSSSCQEPASVTITFQKGDSLQIASASSLALLAASHLILWTSLYAIGLSVHFLCCRYCLVKQLLYIVAQGVPGGSQLKSRGWCILPFV